MPPRKAARKSGAEKTVPADIALPAQVISTTLNTDPLPTVTVNTANLQEVKAALDDIVKKYMLDQEFTPSLLHPTVHLSLGYSSVVIALSAALYSFRVSFEDSKTVLWVAVISYAVLQTALWAWKRWVEKGEVFKGKRRRMVKRIETDHVQIITSTPLTPPPAPVVSFSPHTRPSSPSSSPASPSLSQSPIKPSSPSFSTKTSALTSSTDSKPATGPSYLVHLSLSTTSNKGKSLIHKSRVVVGRGIGELVDESGGVEEGEVLRWLRLILSEAGLVGAEDSDE
ncbi:hypothetical protein B9479_001993 [Cryptococcus floricola]|uniref:Signal peptidase complex subunit 2 n=1 Tax=Cryptococcus floricola TaxID=2591691 RepID=A0A5D3B4Z2_9TREE|nr:hypothetical protein B9479_001993 [Cryptococcus floricola]